MPLSDCNRIFLDEHTYDIRKPMMMVVGVKMERPMLFFDDETSIFVDEKDLLE